MPSRSTRSLAIVKAATVEQFAHLERKKILRFSKPFLVLRIGGFAITVVGGFGAIAWIIYSRQFLPAAYVIGVCTLIGFIAFVASWYTQWHCAICGGKLDQYWCAEERAGQSYSGPIVACGRCNAYEVRLSMDHDG